MTTLPPVLVITCDELAERKRVCIEHFSERRVPAQYLDGIYGKAWGLETTREYDKGYRISPGHVALNINHYMAWQHLRLSLTHDYEYGIVCEDDCVLPVNFDCAVMDVVVELNYKMPNWDLVFLGSGDTGVGTWQKITERIGGPTSRLCKQEYPWGTHCLMIRKKALPVLMERMSMAERNCDQQLYVNVLRDNHLEWCMVMPSLVSQRTFDHAQVGKPEWKPSTIDEKDIPPSKLLESASTPIFSKDLDIIRDQWTDAAIDPFPCIYRGELLSDIGYGKLKANGKTKSVPLTDCIYLNTICHTRRESMISDVTILESGKAVKPCESCSVRLAYGKSPGPRAKLPILDGHFNPSIIRNNEKLILATRDSWGHSAVALWELTNTEEDWTGEWKAKPISSCRSPSPDMPRLEDPRLFHDTGGNELCCMFNLPDNYPPKVVRVGWARFNRDLTVIEHTQVYESPVSNAYEKNWVPFWHGFRLHFVYATKPQHIVWDSVRDVWYTTPNKLPWKAGVVRGGASPIFVPDAGVYYHFMHGCLKGIRGNVYSVGCTVFEARPPFNVLKQTVVPLVWPDEPAHGESVVKRNVVFPGGAIRHAGAWHIACGIDDTNCRIVRIPCETVERALNDQPEDDNYIASIRNTPIALGVSDERTDDSR